MLIDADKMLYPQYDLHQTLNEALTKWEPWAAEQASKKLGDPKGAHPDVIKHWEMLSSKHIQTKTSTAD